MAFNKTDRDGAPMRKKRRNAQKKESLCFLWKRQHHRL